MDIERPDQESLDEISSDIHVRGVRAPGRKKDRLPELHVKLKPESGRLKHDPGFLICGKLAVQAALHRG